MSITPVVQESLNCIKHNKPLPRSLKKLNERFGLQKEVSRLARQEYQRLYQRSYRRMKICP